MSVTILPYMLLQEISHLWACCSDASLRPNSSYSSQQLSLSYMPISCRDAKHGNFNAFLYPLPSNSQLYAHGLLFSDNMFCFVLAVGGLSQRALHRLGQGCHKGPHSLGCRLRCIAACHSCSSNLGCVTKSMPWWGGRICLHIASANIQ